MSSLVRNVFAANRTSLGLDNDQRTISNTLAMNYANLVPYRRYLAFP